MQDEYDRKNPTGLMTIYYYLKENPVFDDPVSDDHFYYLIAVMSHQMTIYYYLKENPTV